MRKIHTGLAKTFKQADKGTELKTAWGVWEKPISGGNTQRKHTLYC